MAWDGAGGTLRGGDTSSPEGWGQGAPYTMLAVALSGTVPLNHLLSRTLRDMQSTCSRSHSCECWLENQAQLCLPVLGYPPPAHRNSSSPKERGRHKARVCVVGASGIMGRGCVQEYWGEQVWSSLRGTPLKTGRKSSNPRGQRVCLAYLEPRWDSEGHGQGAASFGMEFGTNSW